MKEFEQELLDANKTLKEIQSIQNEIRREESGGYGGRRGKDGGEIDLEELTRALQAYFRTTYRMASRVIAIHDQIVALKKEYKRCVFFSSHFYNPFCGAPASLSGALSMLHALMWERERFWEGIRGIGEARTCFARKRQGNTRF